MKKNNILLVILGLFFYTSTSFAQGKFSGQVVDSQTNEPISGVLVKLNHSNIGTRTDFSGKFIIPFSQKVDSLIFSFIGYENYKIPITPSYTIIKLKPSAIALNQVVVSGNRDKKDREEIPMAISILSSTMINDTKAISTDQLLNKSPGVYMVDLGNEQHAMAIRQPLSYKSLFLYLEDGIPIRTSGVFNHNALLEMNMASFRKIEIIRGPASSLYGSEAIGGAVNFLTLNPTAFLTAKASLQTNNLGFKRADFRFSNTYKKWGIVLSTNYAFRKNGYRAHSNYEKLALTAKVNYKINTHAFWSTSLTYVDYRSDMTGSLDSANYFGSEYSSIQKFTNRRVTTTRLKTALNYFWKDHSKSSFTLLFRDNSIKQNPSYRIKDDYSPWGNPNGNKNLAHSEQNDNAFNSYGAILQHKKNIPFFDIEITGGLSFEYSPSTYYANYISVYKSNSGVYESFKSTDSVLTEYSTGLLNGASYLQFEMEPIKNLKLSAALRYDYFLYNYDNNLDSNAFSGVPDETNIFNAITPKIGLVYRFKKNKGIYANYGQGFAPPQVGELYRGVSVPTLVPAVFVNYELGTWLSFLNQKASLDMALFRLDGINEIISVKQLSGENINENAGQTRHQGVEYGLNYQPIKTLFFRISGTNASHKFIEYQEKGNDYAGYNMARAPKWIANSEITYKPKFINGLRLGVEWQHMGKYFMDAKNTSEYKGFDVFHMQVGYQIKGFEVWCNIRNITNRKYATNASKSVWGKNYTPGDPRNFNIGVSYQFEGKGKQ